MGLMDYLTGKGKAAPAPAALSAEDVKKAIESAGLDASKIDVRIEDGNVALSGAASPETAQKIVAAVKSVPGVGLVSNNLVADAAGGAGGAGGDAPGEAGARYYVVKSGDTLWKIAEAQYGAGKGDKYREIFDANRDVLKDPDEIHPGQRLAIPGLGPDHTAAAGEWKAPGDAASPAAGGVEWKPPSDIS